MSRVLSPKMKFNLIVKEISCSQKKKKKVYFLNIQAGPGYGLTHLPGWDRLEYGNHQRI